MIALLAVVWVGFFATLMLMSIYRAPRPGGSSKLPAWITALECDALHVGLSYRTLALVSLLGLFLEMLVIRWISSELSIFAYFKNFVLIASFLGFGLGCYLCRRPLNLLPALVVPILMATLIKLPWEPLRELIRDLPQWLGSTSEVHIWGVPTVPVGWAPWALLVQAIMVVVPLFSLVTLMFIPIGQLVGLNLERCANGITGYSVNVLASLGGILLYTLLCFLDQPPAAWFAVAGILTVWLFWRVPRLRWAGAAASAISVALVAIGPGGDSRTFWSPYQKLTVTPVVYKGETLSLHLNTNDSWYQQVLNLSPAFVAKYPGLFHDVPVEWNTYNLPYRLYPKPASVLVLGAGMGNDVAAALRNGAGRVVAVEIDPLIASLGRALHFEKPYSSPKVHLVVNDARSYLQNSKDSFDLISFSLLDSHTTSSHYSNIRIDNFVYTREALQVAKRLLKPDGLFIVKFQVETPWIAGRLSELLTDAYGHPPIEFRADTAYRSDVLTYGQEHKITSESALSTKLTGNFGSFFVAGSRQRLQSILADPVLAGFIRSHPGIEPQKATMTTDDWPYFYQHEPGLPTSVIVISTVLLALCAFMMRSTLRQDGGIQWHFFFLGAAFLLLEAQIVSKMALLFGTTWFVNSIVVSALMVLILASNWVVSKFSGFSIQAAYIGILVSMLIGYLLPMDLYFFESVWLRAITSLAVLCAPVFFAGIVFVQSFARAGFRGDALGSNLIGALVGGLLESMSMWTGMKSLMIIAGLLYLGSYVALHRTAGARSRRAAELVQVG